MKNSLPSLSQVIGGDYFGSQDRKKCKRKKKKEYDSLTDRKHKKKKDEEY